MKLLLVWTGKFSRKNQTNFLLARQRIFCTKYLTQNLPNFPKVGKRGGKTLGKWLSNLPGPEERGNKNELTDYYSSFLPCCLPNQLLLCQEFPLLFSSSPTKKSKKKCETRTFRKKVNPRVNFSGDFPTDTHTLRSFNTHQIIPHTSSSLGTET